MTDHKTVLFLSALILGLGIFGAGACISKAVYLSKVANRSVMVKGIAEQDVKSDLGIWEIDYREMGNNLAEINQQMQKNQKLVHDFLNQSGFTDTELEIQSITVEDKMANLYQPNENSDAQHGPRYVVTSGIRVRSEKVQAIQQATQTVNALLQQGISLTFSTGNVNPNPSYYYMRLDTIRPKDVSRCHPQCAYRRPTIR